MSENSDLPEGWAMPPDMAKRLSEGVNKKSESPEDKLQKELSELARDIAIIEPNPQDWGWWVTYLLEKLEAEAEKRGKLVDYKMMLKSLLEVLKSSSKEGK